MKFLTNPPKSVIYFFDLVSTIPLAMYFGLLYQGLQSKKWGPIVLCLSLLSMDKVTYLMKRINYPESLYKMSRRPENANKCDYLSRREYNKDSPGFPSGHMTTTTMFAVYQMLKYPSTYSKVLNISLIVLMAFARYVKQCHTVIQIVGGVVLGGISGYGYKKFINIK